MLSHQNVDLNVNNHINNVLSCQPQPTHPLQPTRRCVLQLNARRMGVILPPPPPLPLLCYLSDQGLQRDARGGDRRFLTRLLLYLALSLKGHVQGQGQIEEQMQWFWTIHCSIRTVNSSATNRAQSDRVVVVF